MFNRMGMMVVGAMVFTACGGSADVVAETREALPVDGASSDPSDELFSQESNVIVGSVNWKSSTLLDPASGEGKNAKATGYLSIPAKGTRCTAWLIAKDLVVTNNHCISTQAQAADAKVSFNYHDGVSSSSRIWYTCSTLVKTWTDVDATVLRCTARNGVLPGDVYGTVGLAAANPAASQALYVIHQNCDYYTSPGCAPTKKHSPGVVKSANYTTREISYDADTLGGSSGSGVFASSGTYAHKLVALHHTGLNGNSSGRGTGNAGVKVMSLKARLAEIGL